jgi:hypothetical protein
VVATGRAMKGAEMFITKPCPRGSSQKIFLTSREVRYRRKEYHKAERLNDGARRKFSLSLDIMPHAGGFGLLEGAR